jgi:hypothetical protein
VTLVRTDILEEIFASIIRVKRLRDLGTTLLLTRATRRYIAEDNILHSHRHETLKPYIALIGWAL